MDAPDFGLPIPPSRVLAELPDGTPKMKFVDMEHLEKDVNLQRGRCGDDGRFSPFLVVFDVPETICEQLEDSYELKRTHAFADLKEKAIILETIVSREHEAVARIFDYVFLSKIKQMGLDLAVQGSARVTYGNYSKEPDCSFKPLQPPRAHLRIWPTIVVEVGWSESLNKLAMDAQNWLETEGSLVQIVITIKIERTSQKLIFQKWEKTDRRRTTRSTRPSAEITQEVELWHTRGGTDVSGLLEIPFEKIFDRPRNPNNPREQDVSFTRHDLVEIAEQDWNARGISR